MQYFYHKCNGCGLDGIDYPGSTKQIGQAHVNCEEGGTFIAASYNNMLESAMNRYKNLCAGGHWPSYVFESIDDIYGRAISNHLARYDRGDITIQEYYGEV